MKLVTILDTFYSKSKDETYFCIKYALVDEKGNIVKKSSKPILYLTEEQYKNIKL